MEEKWHHPLFHLSLPMCISFSIRPCPAISSAIHVFLSNSTSASLLRGFAQRQTAHAVPSQWEAEQCEQTGGRLIHDNVH